MAEEQKPVATEAPAVEPVAEPVAEPAPTATEAPAAEPAAAAPAATEEAATTEAAPAAAEETKPAKKVAEPIYSGALGYKAPGVLKSLIFSKRYFWFGEEAVPTSSLNSYLRGEKPEISHPTAAWSSQTGKGLLYFAKHADDKKNPTGVLNLSEASDLRKEGSIEFSFKLHGHKHTFETKQSLERDGWILALEKGIEEAKASAEGIKSSEGYKETYEKLNKPFAVAAAGTTAAKGEAPKTSTEVKPAEGEVRPTSDDETKKAKSKSRSVSRGKRNSIFGSFLGKKEEQPETKKVEEAAPATEAAAAPAESATEAPAEAAATTEEAKPAETTEAAAAAAAAAEPAAEPAAATEAAEASKPAVPPKTKRNSVIGNFFEKIRSPTQEKKLSEVAPPVPAKDEPKEAAAPATEEAAAAPAAEAAPAETTEATAAAPAEEVKPAEAATTPTKKEKKGFSFDKVFGSVKERVKSPTAEKAPAVEEAPKTDEAPKVDEAPATEAAAPAAEVTEAPKAEEAPATEAATPAAAPAAAETPKEKRKSSFFSGFSSVKKEKKADTNGDVKAEEKGPSKLSGLFRNPSKAVKSKKEKEAAKTDEAAAEAPKEEAAEAAEPAATEEKKEEEAAPAPATIGDVVPEAVSVGQAPSSTPAVQAAA